MKSFEPGNWIGPVQLTVEVKDKGNPVRSSSVNLELSFVAPNKHVPEFTSDKFTFSVKENAETATVVGTVSAMGDNSENGNAESVLKYSIIKGDYQRNVEKCFDINETTGEITVSDSSNIDFEVTESYVLRVQVADSGAPRLSAITTVIINVTDVNDNKPFLRPRSLDEIEVTGNDGNLILAVAESLKPPTKLVNLSEFVVDFDKRYDQGWNFKLKSHQNVFQIDQDSGILSALQILDCENTSFYELRVEITEKVDANMAGVSNVTIIVADSVNEFEPVFEFESYFWNISENVPLETVIGEVRATDGDCSFASSYRHLMDQHPSMAQYADSISYFLLAGEGSIISDYLRINSVTGLVSVKKALELKAIGGPLSGKALALNEKNPQNSESCNLTIHIVDVNRAPIFTQAWFNVSVNETNTANEYLLTVEAIDHDYLEQFTGFSYSLEDKMNRILSLDSTSGRISSVVTLDRETYPSGWAFKVYATDAIDSTLFTTAQVFIEILDINDNAPVLPENQCSKTGASLSISENVAIGTTILTLNDVTDVDEPPNQGPFTFKVLAPSDLVFFHENRLKTGRVFDKETDENFLIEIQISDSGQPRKTTTCKFLLEIRDVNDNPSERSEIMALVNIPNNPNIFPVTLATVNPSDKDSSSIKLTCNQVTTWNSFAEIEKNCSLSVIERPKKFQTVENHTATSLIQFSSDDGTHQEVTSDVHLLVNEISTEFEDRTVFLRIEGSGMDQFVEQKLMIFSQALDSLFEIPIQIINLWEAHLFYNNDIVVLMISTPDSSVAKSQLIDLMYSKREQLKILSETIVSSVTQDLCEAVLGLCPSGTVCSYSLEKDFDRRSLLYFENSIFNSFQVNLDVFCACDKDSGCRETECGWNESTSSIFKTCEKGGTCSFTSKNYTILPVCTCPQDTSPGNCERNEEKNVNSACSNTDCGSSGICVASGPDSDVCFCHYPARGKKFYHLNMISLEVRGVLKTYYYFPPTFKYGSKNIHSARALFYVYLLIALFYGILRL